MNGQGRYAFTMGDWRVDPSIDEISRADQRIKLEPRAMRVLVCLAEHAGSVVSVDQLLDTAWKDVVVTPESVYQAIAALRRALGDDPKHPAYIANVVRRGYSLIAPVRREGDAMAAGIADPEPPVPGATAHRPRFPLIAGVLALAAILAGAAWFLAQRDDASSNRGVGVARPEWTIAVLPFTDLSERQDQQYFADGMAEEILDMLAKVPQLKVIGRASSFRFKGSDVNLREIGEKLGASYVVQGSVRRSGSKVRVTTQLIDVPSGTQLWAGSYDREFDDILNVQDAIANNIGRALQLVVVSEESRPRQLHSAEAYTFYLRGRAAYDHGDESGLREAVGHLELALRLDPKFARAAETLALAQLALLGNGVVTSDVAWPRIAAAAQTALDLDPGSALAHALLGLKYATYEYDWPAASRELDLALATGPRDAVALYNLAWLAFDLGRHEEAMNLSERSLSIDPLNPDACQNSAYIYYLVGKLDAAERGARRSMAISPSFTGNRKLLGQIMLLRGEPEKALIEMQQEVEVMRDVGLALVFHALGRHAESDAALTRVSRDSGDRFPVDIAAIHAYRGEADQAFVWLEKAVAARDLSLGHKYRDEPKFEPIRDDPRYQALLRRMNLAD